MSSVTRFIRQIPVSTTYYDAGSIVNPSSGAITTTNVYEFVPDGGNYVGNYPPGVVIACSAQLSAALAQAVQGVVAAGGSASAFVLRDMGKTIKAPLTTATGSVSFFRQVQLLNPTPLSASQGSIGGLGGSTFGVLGGNYIPDNYTNFLTFYIPVTVAGVRAAAGTAVYAIAGGQM